MSTPHNLENWRDRDWLVNYLAEELLMGRLCLFLGAGVSKDSGLPDWKSLVNNICDEIGEERLKDQEDPTAKIAGIKLRNFKKESDKESFLAATHKALYDGFNADFVHLRTCELLSAVAAITIAATSIYSPKIITLNYDNLLELYLEYYGCLVSSIYDERHWATGSDVTIYHPHGFLPFSPEEKKSDEIVFEHDDYMKILEGKYWKPLLQTTLRTHTTIYIGMSGDDLHVKVLLNSMKELHAIENERIKKHGVFIKRGVSLKLSDEEAILDNTGLQIHKVKAYSDIPEFLFAVSQQARKLKLQN